VPFRDWMPEFQETWDSLPVDFEALTGEQEELAEWLFEEGFMHFHGEIPEADIEWAREQFFELMDIDAEQFDWEGWREAMGYE
jgi:hypothetical protein